MKKLRGEKMEHVAGEEEKSERKTREEGLPLEAKKFVKKEICEEGSCQGDQSCRDQRR